jgi:isopentenyl phosphate kinase
VFLRWKNVLSYDILLFMKLTVIKIGGSVITNKLSNLPSINRENIEEVSKQLSSVIIQNDSKFIIIHGVGSYGHPIVKATGINKGINDKQQVFAFTQTQRLQNELNCIVVESLQRYGIPAMPCQFSGNVVMDKGKIFSFDLGAIKGMLDSGLVPVGYGVPAYDRSQGCSILSGDQSAPYLAVKLGAQKIIVASDVEGIYTKDPKINIEAKLIPEIDSGDFRLVAESLGGSQAIDVTGGMRQKFLELEVAAEQGISVQIVHFKKIAAAVLGNNVGTKIISTVNKASVAQSQEPNKMTVGND